MNKKIHKLNQTILDPESREGLIERLEKLAARLDSPDLTMDEFEKIKAEVQTINERLKKSVAAK